MEAAELCSVRAHKPWGSQLLTQQNRGFKLPKTKSFPVTKKPGLWKQLLGNYFCIIQPALSGRPPAFSVGCTTVPRFYFHQYLNGQFVEDRLGRQFPSAKEACEHAVHRTPAVLRKVAGPTSNTYLATEITDGTRTVVIVRGKVIIEKQ
jgi:hypothetical protein